MSSKELEYEYESMSEQSDDEQVEEAVIEEKQLKKPVETVVPSTVVEPPKKVKKPMKPDDKRAKGSSAKNLEKARATRLAKIAAVKEAAKNQYVIDSSESEEEEDVQPVLTKGRKAQVVTAQEAKMREMELKLEAVSLKLEKLELQHKAKKQPKVYQITAAAAATPANVQAEKIKKKYLDL